MPFWLIDGYAKCVCYNQVFKPGPLFNAEAKKQISSGIPYTHSALIKIFDSDKHSSLLFRSADENKNKFCQICPNFFKLFEPLFGLFRGATTLCIMTLSITTLSLIIKLRHSTKLHSILMLSGF